MPFIDSKRWFEVHPQYSSRRNATPAIFLDRDGVIIVEKNYLRDPDQVELLPGVFEKLESFIKADLPIVVVTNQSGIGRGFFGWDEYHAVHQRMLDLLGLPQTFAAVYANSYLPGESGSAWRKPNPGMIRQAAEDLNLSLESSIMVGDKLDDLKAGSSAGIKRLVHVRTGHGSEERATVLKDCPEAETIESLAQLVIDVTLPVS